MNLFRLFDIAWLSVAGSIAAAALIQYDASAYFGSWFYLILVISFLRKAYRWINFSIFLAFNSVAFWIVTGSTWIGITLTLASVILGGVSIYFQQKSMPCRPVNKIQRGQELILDMIS